MSREDNQRNPVASDLILPLSLGWERHFADDSSFTDFVRDFALTHYELRYYGDAVPTRDYDDTLDFFEVPGTDYMPHRYLHTTHLTEAPNHITYGPLNPFSFFSYFDDLYVDSRILYSRSTDLPIRERRPFIKFQQSHDEMFPRPLSLEHKSPLITVTQLRVLTLDHVGLGIPGCEEYRVMINERHIMIVMHQLHRG
ncbi:hypothetical protein PM082_023928 [Marasmius tenuissimus]|nr:hypothetical protein PM082_023928 [Marasmius tenuissimus]